MFSQVNHIEQQYIQDWLVLGSFPSHELDVTSLPIPKDGTVVTGIDEKTRTWKRLKSVYKNAHLYPFYQEQTGSTLYLFSQIESSKNQIIYLTFTGINYQDQLWINETEIDNSKNWKAKQLKTLKQNYSKHPFKDDVNEVIEFMKKLDENNKNRIS